MPRPTPRARRLFAAVLFALLAAAGARSAPAEEPAPAPVLTEQQLLGSWLSISPAKTPLQTVLNFLPGGQLQVALAARFVLHYEVLSNEGGQLRIALREEGSDTPQELEFELRDNELILRLDASGNQQVMQRLGDAADGDPSIVGRWRWQQADRPPGIMEFTSDGAARFDSVVQRFEGTYQLEGSSVRLQEKDGSREGTVLSLSGDGLIGVDAEGKPTVAYRRAEGPPPSP
jgi:hypothetical protein